MIISNKEQMEKFVDSFVAQSARGLSLKEKIKLMILAGIGNKNGDMVNSAIGMSGMLELWKDPRFSTLSIVLNVSENENNTPLH